MRLLDFFRRSRKPIRRKRQASKIGFVKNFESNIVQLQSDLQTIRNKLEQHSSELVEHKRLIDSHSEKFLKLEEIVAGLKSLSENVSTNRPLTATNQPNQFKQPVDSLLQKHNVENFSPQEKGILTVFFQNPQMSLSYIDVAKLLNKSPNTVKNQLRQLTMKANLFDKAIDNENRNRFKLKDGLKIEQYLNLN